MARLPLYHQTARDGHGGIPGWWFGAPIVAFAYALVIPRFLSDPVAMPEGLPRGLDGILRWLIGLLLGVVLLSGWQFVLWARKRNAGPL
jgi:hypothetical protein